MVIETTVQVRVSDFEKGKEWYKSLLNKEPDFAPHEGFVEFELVPGSWLQVSEGTPTKGSGPLRMGVMDIEAERNRIVKELNMEPFEIYSREEVPVKWGSFTDPWGNELGFFEYLDENERDETIKRVHGKKTK